MVREELSRREREVVDILFRTGRATAVEIGEAMAAPPSNASIRTVLRVLEAKGIVKRRRTGRRDVYEVRKNRKKEGQSALRRVLDVFFSGSVLDAVAAHLADPKNRLDPDEADRLRALIDAADDRTGRRARDDSGSSPNNRRSFDDGPSGGSDDQS